MSDRLASLNRQRQLIEEHLRWLDTEIANESPEATHMDSESSGNKSTTPTHSALEPGPKTIAAIETKEAVEDVEALTNQLISQYGCVSTRREMDPRLGLLLFFGGILGLMGLVVFLFYWFGYR